MTLRRLLALVAALIAVAVFHPATILAQTDVIRGRITGPDSLPVDRATITVTSISGNVNRTTRTDKEGRFTVTFPGGDGDYMVNVAALGYAQKRFEVKRTAEQEILLADARLSRTAQNLDAVKVQAARDKVDRNQTQPDISGSERPVNAGNISADQLGDLAAMAASMPGVQLIPGLDGAPNGFSMLGLSADQNMTTLNGMNFGGNNLPRDAAVNTSLTTSPYDVSRGGFSGGQFNITTRPGTNFINRTSSLNADAPTLQWTDPAGRSLGQQYSNVSLSGLVSGPIAYDKAFYNISYQLGRRANDLQTLTNTNALGLQTAGIAVDSVTRLMNILHTPSFPSMFGRSPTDRLSDQGSVFGSFDFNPPFSTTGQTFNVTLNGSWNKQAPSGVATTELPTHSGDRVNWNGGIVGRHTNYFGFGILSETQLGLNEQRAYGSPYLELPNGSVRVNSTFADGTSGVKMLSFGGNPSMNTSQTTMNANFMNALSWFSENNKHRIKLTSELRREAYRQDLTTNTLGSFTYNSLIDLQAGVPAQFTRQLSPSLRSASQWTGAVSLGDAYRPNPDLQIQYGLRVDANRYAVDPALNPAVETIYGTRNDQVPNRVYLSPRIGFSKTIGTAPQVAAFDGAFRGPRAVVRGGVGVFQNTPATGAIGGAVDNTGLPTAVQQLNCVGTAAPVGNWSTYGSVGTIPTQCADGTSGSVFANTSPNVTLLDRDYVAPRSVRSNLQWSGPILNNRFTATVDGTYSLNLNQPGFVDLNFKPTAQFQLADEAARPVYVQATSIVPTTGTIASRDARVSPLFSRVTELRSDLRSESRQLTLRLAPMTFSTAFTWNVAYVYSNVRERFRGFSSTVADPFEAAWGRSSLDSRHQVTYSLGYNFFDWVRVNWFGSLRSGNPYTPMVAGDINGDGYANDRAFVFDPTKATDATLAASMKSLLDNGSSSARDCLSRQLGQLAQRNSCNGPLQSTATLSFNFNPVKVRMPQRASISFQLSNPLGAADLLLHDDSKLHGWGQTPFPDASLLYVRGFDPLTNKYKYQVNERFGATNPAFSAIRTPVVLTAMMRVDVGPTRERQMLTQQLDRGRSHAGTKLPEQMLKAIYGTGGIMNPMAQILRQADTLQLTGEQADSVASLNRYYTIHLDSIWSPVAKYLAALPESYDQSDAYGRYRHAREASVDLLIGLVPRVNGLITGEQRRKLPAFVTSYLDKRYLASIRSGTAGGFGGPMSIGGMPMMAGVGGGGAGVEQRIIIVR